MQAETTWDWVRSARTWSRAASLSWKVRAAVLFAPMTSASSERSRAMVLR